MTDGTFVDPTWHFRRRSRDWFAMAPWRAFFSRRPATFSYTVYYRPELGRADRHLRIVLLGRTVVGALRSPGE